jgi:Flp pilus assembly pilin Flp
MCAARGLVPARPRGRVDRLGRFDRLDRLDRLNRLDRLGQGLVEYGLILALSALFAVVLLVFFGGTLSAVLEAIGQAIERAS